LLEPIRHANNDGFRAVIFRRTTKQITAGGGLWDTAGKVYPQLGGVANQTALKYTFGSGAEVKFTHLEHEKNKYDHDGAQYALLGFDELIHFTRSQFFYLLSRLRTTCGVRPYVRATTNPDAGSWVKGFIAWWLDAGTGYPIPERVGTLRWFYVVADEVCWYDTREEAEAAHPDLAADAPPLSATFIPARLSDNAILCAQDPSYRAKLKALSWVERSRLEDGNWNTTAADGLFKAEWFPVPVPADKLPGVWKRKVRAWDLAATEQKDANDPDWLVGCLMGQDEQDRYWVLDVRRYRISPLKVKQTIRNTAAAAGTDVEVVIEQEAAAAGKILAEELRSWLTSSKDERGEPQTPFRCYIFRPDRTTGDKVTRAYPLSAACEQGRVWLAAGAWNKAWLAELCAFPTKGVHDDQVDAAATACRRLTQGGRLSVEFIANPAPVVPAWGR
jgi:predicted phage terminase large subunit-like protein